MITVLDVIKQVASLHGSVEYVGQGDVFGVSNETNIKYPAVWVDIVEGESDLNNLDPTYIIYYIDRVADDLSDALHKQNDSMYVLGDIMTEISNYYAFSTPIRVQPFREKFLDNCAGGWVQVKFTHCISALGIDSSISLDDKSLIPGRYVAYDSSMNIVEKVDSTTRSVDSILEDKYILRYVVPVNTNYIDLTLDKNGNAINIAEGETFEIIIPIREWVNPSGTSRINLRFNGVASNIYRVGNTGPFSNMITQGSNYFNNDVRVKLTLVGGNLQGYTLAYQENPKGTFVAGTPQMYGCRTDGYSFSAINRIELLVANANEIPAGVVILLKKI